MVCSSLVTYKCFQNTKGPSSSLGPGLKGGLTQAPPKVPRTLSHSYQAPYSWPHSVGRGSVG